VMSSMSDVEEREQQALTYLSAAEKTVLNPPEIAGGKPAMLDHVAIVGGGLMGTGIATSCLLGGLSVTLIEQTASAAEKASDGIRGFLEGAVKRSKITAEERDRYQQRLWVSGDIGEAEEANFAIEAVFEDLDVKRQVFRHLAGILQPTTPIATNTSYLDPRMIAKGLEHPERFLGLHFFSPAHVMKLVEVVATPTTSKDVLATAFSLAGQLRKIPVLSGICDGFIGNRMLQAYRRQADYMLIDGCLPSEIDHAMRRFGMPMGPYELQDLTGLQIGFANRRRLDATRDPDERYVSIADELYELGRFGQRAGKGWYRYEEGERAPKIDEDVTELILKASAKSGIERCQFTEDEIQSRLLAVLINEGGHILDEGIAGKKDDIDLVKINGYGFPRKYGGPMFYGDQIGRERIAATMQEVIAQSPNSWCLADYVQQNEA